MKKKQFPVAILLGIVVVEIVGFYTYKLKESNISDISRMVEEPVVITNTISETADICVNFMSIKKPEESKFLPYDIPLDVDIQKYIYDSCTKMEIPFDLIIAIIKCESNFNEKAVSKTNDYGLMQINKSNHQWLSKTLGITDFLNARQNIDAGIYMISDLYKNEKNLDKMLMIYNCGPSGAKKLWNKGIYSTAYTRKIIHQMETLEERR